MTKMNLPAVLLLSLTLHALIAAVAVGTERKLIRNGTPAPPDKYPSFVGLNVRGTGLICGGTLVAEDVMLTAAHCINFPKFQLPLFLLYVSVQDERHQVTEVTTYPEYDPSNRDSGGCDLMLVKFSHPVTDPDRIVTLNKDPLTLDTVAWLAGDGLTAPDWKARPSQLLEATDLKVIDCPADYPYFDEAGLICTMAGPSQADPCSFDSGSPLFNATNGHQIGILSTGVSHEEGAIICVETYSGFTSVAKFYDWIQESIQSLSAETELPVTESR